MKVNWFNKLIKFLFGNSFYKHDYYNSCVLPEKVEGYFVAGDVWECGCGEKWEYTGKSDYVGPIFVRV